jgi:lactoylglutathione lyase
MTQIFRNLGHIAVRVRDLKRSVAFYERIGFPEMLRLLNDNGEPWIVYMRITDDQYLELFPGGVGDWSPVGNGTGIFHICLTVADIDKAEADLAVTGVRLSRPKAARPGIDGNRGMWIEDPDGNQIEIMEMAPNCIQLQAIARLHAEGAVSA